MSVQKCLAPILTLTEAMSRLSLDGALNRSNHLTSDLFTFLFKHVITANYKTYINIVTCLRKIFTTS